MARHGIFRSVLTITYITVINVQYRIIQDDKAVLCVGIHKI
jgi:hypothetical protein